MLNITDPDHTIGAVSQAGKECELDWAGILKLINHEKVDLLRQNIPHLLRGSQKLQRVLLQVLKINSPSFAFQFLKTISYLSGNCE